MYPLENVSGLAQVSIDYSKKIAGELGHEQVGTEHLLLGILREINGIASIVLRDIGIVYEEVRDIVVDMMGRGEPRDLVKEFTPKAKRVFELSLEESIRIKSNRVGTEHLLIGIIREEECLGAMIIQKLIDFDMDRIIDELLRAVGKEEYTIELEDILFEEELGLKLYGRDLTELARRDKLDPVIGRESEIERVIQILSRRTKNNPCLIGEPGVGKTAVVEGLAKKIISAEVPDTLKDKKIISLDLASMVAGAKYRGEFEERLKQVIDEAYNSQDVILFIDEIHTVVGAGSSEGSIDAANIMKPALARGELQTIGATTSDEYRKYIEKDSALERRFQIVRVEEPSREDAISILKGLRDRYEEHHGVEISDQAIVSAVNISKRYITDRYLPDKAIDLIDEASSRVRLKVFTPPDHISHLELELERLSKEKEDSISNQQFEKAAEIRDAEEKIRRKLDREKEEWDKAKQSSKKSVLQEDIAEVASMWTGIPIKNISLEESSVLLDLEKLINKKVIGQEEAVRSISSAVKRARVGLKDPNKPVGSFIFAGPTGVGKTYLAKVLAETLFGDEGAMVRFDMSEYMEKHTVSRLIGSPPGYIGYEEGGQLTRLVKEKPYSIILFDEIEKAHPDVFNILLQLLDDGRLTDAKGKLVDFKNTIIIMTSNIGASNFKQKEIGFSLDDKAREKNKELELIKTRVNRELKRTFRPEFLNRIDDIIVFKPLEKDEISKLVENMIVDLSKRLKDIDIQIEVSESARDHLASKGYDREYGARTLERAIRNVLEDKFSEEILRGNISSGDSVVVDYGDSQVLLRKKNARGA